MKFYLNPAMTPELVPMWSAFNVMATIRVQREGEEEIAQQMARYGVTTEGCQQILALAREHKRIEEERVAQVGPLQVELIKLQWEAVARLGETSDESALLKRAIDRGEAETVALILDQDEPKVRRLLKASKTDPLAETAERTLPRLKERVTQADWDGLRRYLLAEVVSRFGPIVDYT